MKLFELKKKKGLPSSVYAIALVENPAIEVDFVYLNKDLEVKLKYDEKKGIIYTPVLIPDKKIRRINESTGEEYEIYFSGETVREVAHDFSASGILVKAFNEEHNDTRKLEGVTVVENWVVDDPKTDKANKLGFKIPKDTWMQGIKVDNPEMKLKIEMGKIKGVSIEGLFDHFEAKLSNQLIKSNINQMENLTALEKAISFLKGNVKLADEGDKTKLAALENGTYTLEDGRKIQVMDGVVEVMEVDEEEMKEKKSFEERMTSNMEELAKVTQDNFEKITKDMQTMKSANESLKQELSKIKDTPAGESATKLSTKEDGYEFKNLKRFNLK